MKTLIAALVAVMAVLAVAGPASPARATTTADPNFHLDIRDTSRPASGCKEVGYLYAGGAAGQPWDILHFTSPSGFQSTANASADVIGWGVCADTELGTWTVYSERPATGETTPLDNFVVSAATAPAPSPGATGGSAASSNDKCATREEFKRIKQKMTLKKVKRIVGSKGRLTASSAHLKIRQWDNCTNEYGVMTVGFWNGRVQSKSLF